MSKIKTKTAKIESKITKKPEVKTEFSYKDYEELKRFINDRGKIISRSRSGVSAKQQRRLTTAIKRARFLGLLPF